MKDYRPQSKHSSPIVTIANAATAETLYSRTTGGTVARTVVLKKIMAYNGVGATTLMIGTGTGGAWVQRYPTMSLVAMVDNEWGEDEIPHLELGADLTVQTDVLGVQVQVEVIEIGS
jgi:hypothetical protein